MINFQYKMFVLEKYLTNIWKFYIGLNEYKNAQILKNIIIQINGNNIQTPSFISDREHHIIQEIKNDAFETVPGLTEVRLNHKSLEIIEPFVFRPLKNLQTLNLSENSLHKLPDDLFFGLFNLKHLDLSKNNLKSLGSDLFSQLKNLEELNLSCNQLYRIDKGDFSGLSNLTHLYFDQNPINDIEHGSFCDLRKLEILNFDCDKISSMNLLFDLFENFDNLTELKVDNMDETVLKDIKKHHKDLSIDTGHNNIKKIKVKKCVLS